jgi:hypothetical protein
VTSTSTETGAASIPMTHADHTLASMGLVIHEPPTRVKGGFGVRGPGPGIRNRGPALWGIGGG